MPIARYVLNQKHRVAKPTDVASIWRISDWHEVSLCSEAALKNWVCAKGVLWNTSHTFGAAADRLGEDQEGDLWVAKFVSDNNSEWHGYPVRPLKSDIPPAAAIREWCDAGRIDVTDARRMQRGQLK